MSNFEMNPDLMENSLKMSIVDPAKSPSSEKKVDPPATDYLVTQCESLLENNFSKYDKCLKQQEDFRLRLIEGNKNHSYFRSWLENANKDCLAIKPNYGHLSRTYKILLKNNVVQNFIEHGVTRERLNMRFLSAMMRIEDLKKGLCVFNGDVISLKSEYEEIQYREVLLQISSSEKSLEYVELGKSMRLKSVDLIYELERIQAYLDAVGKEMVKLNSDYEELTRNYQVLLQDPIVKEFFDYAKYQDSLQSKSTEKAKEFEFDRSSLEQVGHETVSRQTEYEQKLNAEQKRREQMEKENCSLSEYSEKLCYLLYKYQCILVDKIVAEKSSLPQNTLAPSDLNTSAPEVNETNDKEMGAHENGLHSQIPCSEKDNHMPVDEEKRVEGVLHTEEIDFAVCCRITEVVGNFVEKRNPIGIEKRDPIVEAVLSSLSNEAKSSPPTIQEPLPVTQELHNSILPRPDEPTLPVIESYSSLRNSRKLHAVTDLYCNSCNRYYSTSKSFRSHKRIKHGSGTRFKCVVCGDRFVLRKNMTKHMVAKHPSLYPYKCSLCNWATNDSKSLTKHLQVIHQQKKGRYCCTSCGQRFMQKETMIRHACVYIPTSQ